MQPLPVLAVQGSGLDIITASTFAFGWDIHSSTCGCHLTLTLILSSRSNKSQKIDTVGSISSRHKVADCIRTYLKTVYFMMPYYVAKY